MLARRWRSLLQPGFLASKRHFSVPAPSTTTSAVPAVTAYQDDPVYIAMSHLLKQEAKGEEQVAALDPSVFAHPIRRDILYLCVNFYRDALRQGTASTKTRSEVRGSGRKIRPQKGSGKARLGDGQSPMLRGGGIAFGPKPRDFATSLPRKVRQMGMRVALSAKVQEHALAVAPSLDWQGGRTNEFAERLEELGWGRTLFIAGAEEAPAKLERVCRNLQQTHVLPAASLNVYELLRWPRLVMDVHAVDYLERLLSKTLPEEQRIPMASPPNIRFSRMEAGRRGKKSAHIEEVDGGRDSHGLSDLYE